MKLELQPIGLIRSPCREAEGTPIQPHWPDGVEGTVEVFPQFAAGWRDLDGFPVERAGWYANAQNRATADGRFAADARIVS